MIIGVIIRTKLIGPENAFMNSSSSGKLQSKTRTVTIALLSRMFPPDDSKVLLSLFIQQRRKNQLPTESANLKKSIFTMARSPVLRLVGRGNP